MIVNGAILRGLNFRGQPDLNSIGNAIFRYDYRFGISVSGSNILKMNDLSPNGFDLTPKITAQQVGLYSDGVGTSGGTGFMNTNVKSQLSKLHNGSAHMFWVVMRYNNPTDSTQSRAFVASGQGSGGQGVIIDFIANRFQHRFYDATGTVTSTQQTAVDSVPEDSTYRLLVFVYYGSGGSNNSRMLLGNTVDVSVTRNPTFPTGLPYRFQSPSFGSLDLLRVKAWGAYDLTGKTTTEINTFLTIFKTTLLQDTEYSTILTY